MKVGVPKEVKPGERRVALVPDSVKKLADAGFDVVVERGAGQEANLEDAAYEEAGATLGDASTVREADAIVKVAAPGPDETPGRGKVLIGFLSPLNSPDLVKRLADAGVTSFAMEAIPRTTRAQAMDALSSQAVVAGYRATLARRPELGKFLPMLITAAGTAKPARVLVLGAGVAGLQAIATAKRLGAVVEAYDVRPAVKEEVQSLGAKFVEIEVQAGGARARAPASTRRRCRPTCSAASRSCSRTASRPRTSSSPQPPFPAGPHRSSSARRWCAR